MIFGERVGGNARNELGNRMWARYQTHTFLFRFSVRGLFMRRIPARGILGPMNELLTERLRERSPTGLPAVARPTDRLPGSHLRNPTEDHQ